jgi:hypothetical protein
MAGNRQPAEIVSDNNEKTTLFPVPIRGRSDNYNLIFPPRQLSLFADIDFFSFIIRSGGNLGQSSEETQNAYSKNT